MIKKIAAYILPCFLFLQTIGQDYKFVYYLDKDLNSVSKQNAIITGKAYEQNGSLILNCFLKATGKLVITATVKDSTLSTLQGPFKTYYNNLRIESEGNYAENDMHGVWKYWDSTGYVTDSVIYNQGIRVAYANYKYYYSTPSIKQLLYNPVLKDTLKWYRYTFTDSLKNTFAEKEISIKNGKEVINFEVYFIGERGLLKEYDSTGAVKTDSVFTRQLQEASFIGGELQWKDFLRKNLNPGVLVDHNASDGMYTVIIKFIVKPDGTLEDLKAEYDPGYGLVEEAIRVIKASKKWQPAIRYGKYERAYRRQPVTFVIEGQGR